MIQFEENENGLLRSEVSYNQVVIFHSPEQEVLHTHHYHSWSGHPGGRKVVRIYL